MAQSTTLTDLVRDRVVAHLAARTPILLGVAPDLAAVTEFSRQFLGGGKRFRARFCHLGWASGKGDGDGHPDAVVIAAAAALEIFHAAALVHDDLIDNSDTRRGGPSAHRHLEAMHRSSGFGGDAARFGRAAALLTGDLLLALSDELFDEAVAACPRPIAAAAKREFSRMRLEVTAGQYLDVLEEDAWVVRDDDDQLARAWTIAVYKSAKYSIEEPLVIGALLGGAGEPQIEALRRYGRPLGVAYQLRDDLLGVYGDPARTGKPAGDDLREGKRTVLVALARRAMTPAKRDRLDSVLGNPKASDEDIRAMQDAIVTCGAVRELERRVESHLARASDALEGAPFDEASVGRLREIARSAVHRDA
ncbi:MAG TPA: polyprenyl synthetase family protein [Microbacteriaceae bacterium]|nr:polyprenyl synthetase family protein [Microbacteriaceae bacterium]